jgi:hypothetical protein
MIKIYKKLKNNKKFNDSTKKTFKRVFESVVIINF